MSTDIPDLPDEPQAQSSFLKNLLVMGLGAISTVYLINPTAGLIEIIPDVIPVIGNLDEAVAVGLLLNCLRYYGIDLTKFFSRSKPPPGPDGNGPTP